MCPTLYGFIPQTFCGQLVGELCAERTGRSNIYGDKDPMDICVLTEKAFAHGSFFLRAKPIGGLRMIDAAQADDKIIAVLESDLAYAMSTYRRLAASALRLASEAPLTPAAFRDATGTSRKYVLAILEDLDRKAVLRRTPAGHVPGPKAPVATR